MCVIPSKGWLVDALTLMLLVQWVGLPQPHQTDEQQHRPEDLHQEASLEGRREDLFLFVLARPLNVRMS